MNQNKWASGQDADKYAEGGEVDHDHEAVLDQVASECMDAIANKDKESFGQCLEVLISDMLQKMSK